MKTLVLTKITCAILISLIGCSAKKDQSKAGEDKTRDVIEIDQPSEHEPNPTEIVPLIKIGMVRFRAKKDELVKLLNENKIPHIVYSYGGDKFPIIINCEDFERTMTLLRTADNLRGYLVMRSYDDLDRELGQIREKLEMMKDDEFRQKN